MTEQSSFSHSSSSITNSGVYDEAQFITHRSYHIREGKEGNIVSFIILRWLADYAIWEYRKYDEHHRLLEKQSYPMYDFKNMDDFMAHIGNGLKPEPPEEFISEKDMEL